MCWLANVPACVSANCFCFHHFRVRIICRNVFLALHPTNGGKFCCRKASCSVSPEADAETDGKSPTLQGFGNKTWPLVSCWVYFIIIFLSLSSAYLSIKHILFALNRIKFQFVVTFVFKNNWIKYKYYCWTKSVLWYKTIDYTFVDCNLL